MKCLPLVGWIVSIAMVTTPAHADRAEELVTEGQRLGKDGQLAAAIAKFREAERIQPRALHDCLIGLAYARAGELVASEIAFATCRRRAALGELPSWVASEERALAATLAVGKLGRLQLELDPEIATIRIAAVGADAFVPPPAFHLPAGSHVIVARTRDGREVRRTIEIVANEQHTVRLTADPDPPATPVPATPSPTRSGSRLPTALLLGGAGAIVAGGLVHVFVVRPAYQELETAADAIAYDDALPRYRAGQIATIGLYVAGAALAATGFVLRAREPERPVVGARVGSGHAMVTVEWRR